MAGKRSLSRRLVFAIPAAAIATLLVFAVMEYLATMGKPSASDLDRYVKAQRIKESEDPKPPAGLGSLVVSGSGPPYDESIPDPWPPLDIPPPVPQADPEYSSRMETQGVPHDPEAVRKLLAEPDRPRNARWILLKGAKPEYPPEALQRGDSGYAVVEFVITEKGRTAGIRVVDQSRAEFGRAARRTVRDWRFIPRHENGRPVASETVRLRIEFRMEG